MRYSAMTALLVSMAIQLSAQTPSAPPQLDAGFEVVSIKPLQPGRIPLLVGGGCAFGGGVRVTCPSTVEQLIKMAFRLNPDGSALRSAQIAGGPGWLSTSQFEIVGILKTAVDQRELPAALPSLIRQILETRFKLVSHAERRDLPIYALVKANKDGRLGPKMHPASTDCPPPPQDAPALPSTPASGERRCYGGSFRVGSIQSGSLAVAGLAGHFNSMNAVDRTVIDRAELPGRFEIDLRWTPLSTRATPGLQDGSQSDVPDLFTAIREQLGLKLEPTTEMMDVLVIDHVELPEPN